MYKGFINGDKTLSEPALKKLGFVNTNAVFKNIRLLSETPLKTSLDEIIGLASTAPDPDSALNNLESIASAISADKSMGAIATDADNLRRLMFIAGSSSYLSNILSRNPDFIDWLFSKGLCEKKTLKDLKDGLLNATNKAEDFDSAAKALRQFKQKEFLRIGARDLLGLATLIETTGELSDLASASLDRAYSFSLDELKKSYGAPLYADEAGAVKEASLSVIGLGKLGGRELNFSSDIDILFIYSSDKGETTGVSERPTTRISLHAFFVKLSTMITRLISSVTEDGFVFRVDLDLRPEGRGGDMANSLRSAEIYYESWGRGWERAALIKARPVAGDIGLGEEFISIVRPFVFRRYLDFTAIEEIRSMKEKIDLSLLKTTPDAIDVKLGQGGIREIEFFCQTHQLIQGGKDPYIRGQNTLDSMDRLFKKGYATKDDVDALSDAYVFLRNLEHRIQIVEGRQTQAIPGSPGELERLARMMGFKDEGGQKAGGFFWASYREATERVHSIFRSLFYKPQDTLVPEGVMMLFSPDITDHESTEALKGLGFKEPEAAVANLKLLKSWPAVARLGAKAQVLLERLSPLFIMHAVNAPDPDRALSFLERFISTIGARTAFYSLLSENPKALEELLKIFGTSVFLSRAIIEHPENMDLLLSRELAVPYKTRAGLLREFQRETGLTDDYEARIDGLRRIKNQEVFRIGVNDIGGALTPRQVSVQITRMAEAAIDAALKIASDELIARHGCPASSGFAVLGLGRLGGAEMIYGSDIDVVFAYSEKNPGSTTTGPKSISNHEYFVKLAQRIINILSLRTREGIVFSVDARLRPSGSSGPLVVSRDSLIRYHAEKTALWERQAFIKARPVAGDIGLGAGILKELSDAIYSKGLSAEDAVEMMRIRKRMELEIAKEDSTRYNIKTGRGAIVDIEFMIQALQLKYGGKNHALKTPYTLKALKRLVALGILGHEAADSLRSAYSFLRLLETRLRIVEDRPVGVLMATDERALMGLAKTAGYSGHDSFKLLLNDYKGFAEKVRKQYNSIMSGLAS